MDAAEYGLTRGTCLVSRRPEMVADAGMRFISWGVLGEAAFFRVFDEFAFS